MKKFIIAAAVVLTVGLSTAITKNNSAKAEKITRTEALYNKSISLGTAD
ncbi:MAG: hypothetical protein ACXVAY_13935 [Mucilaginibacter sp.]